MDEKTRDELANLEYRMRYTKDGDVATILLDLIMFLRLKESKEMAVNHG